MSNLPRNADEYRQWYLENIPEGVRWCECWCGCNKPTKAATRTHLRWLKFKDEPLRFVTGHMKSLNQQYRIESRGYTTDCWIWTGVINEDGYGKRVLDGKQIPAHRFMYERTYGPLSSFPAVHLHHLCEVKSCVNPAHLSPQTALDHRRMAHDMRLTYKDVRVIKRLIIQGMPPSSIAKRFGISVWTIYDIARGRRWKDVKPS